MADGCSGSALRFRVHARWEETVHMARMIKVDRANLDGQTLDRIAGMIHGGRVIAYPTDTFYGLGCDPFNEAAVQRLLEVKGRQEGKPVLLLISDFSLVDELSSERPQRFEQLSQRFWPGPLTLVLRASERLSPDLTGGTGTIGLRLPDHELCRRILATAGGVLTGTSANLTGQLSPETAEEVLRQLGEAIDLVLDGGPTPGGQPSTVLDITCYPPRLIRRGALSPARLEEFFGCIDEAAT